MQDQCFLDRVILDPDCGPPAIVQKSVPDVGVQTCEQIQLVLQLDPSHAFLQTDEVLVVVLDNVAGQARPVRSQIRTQRCGRDDSRVHRFLDELGGLINKSTVAFTNAMAGAMC